MFFISRKDYNDTLEQVRREALQEAESRRMIMDIRKQLDDMRYELGKRMNGVELSIASIKGKEEMLISRVEKLLDILEKPNEKEDEQE